MALPNKPTAITQVVCMNDPALDVFTAEELTKYGQTRRLKDLDLTKCTEEKPTVFHVKPLHRKFADTMAMAQPSDLFRLFCYHCVSIDNSPWKLDWEETDTGQHLKNNDANWEALPDTVYIEIGGTVIQRASKGDDLIPFTSPDTWFRERQIRSVRLHASKVAVHGDETAN